MTQPHLLDQPARRFYKPLISVLVLFALIGIASSLNQDDWVAYSLHQISTVAAIAGLLLVIHQFRARLISAIMASAFVVIHMIGAAYLYSYVPYNEVVLSLTGFNIDQTFGFERNMYDRLVHFSYGLLLYPLMSDSYRGLYKTSGLALVWVVLMTNMAGSMLYEVIEWQIGVNFSEGSAENYNGQQGDIWDAQKDMLIALVGGGLGALIPRFRQAKAK